MRFHRPIHNYRNLSRPLSSQSYGWIPSSYYSLLAQSQTDQRTSTPRWFGSTRTLHLEQDGFRIASHFDWNRTTDEDGVDFTDYDSIIPGMSSSSSASISPYGSLGDPVPTFSSPVMSWQATQNFDVQRVTQQAMIYELQQSQNHTIEKIVPWFLQQMPTSYFRHVPERLRTDHIKAIAAVQDANMDLYLNLKSNTHDGRLIYTFIRSGTEPGTLLDMVKELPRDSSLPLTRMHVFSSRDQSMSLNMFVYGYKPFTSRPIDSQPAQIILQLAQQIQDGTHATIAPNPLLEKKVLFGYLQKCSDNFLQLGSRDPERFLKLCLLFHKVSGTEGCEVQIEEASEISQSDDEPVYSHQVEPPPQHFWIDIAVANSIPQMNLEHVCKILLNHKMDVVRARLDVLDDDENGNVTLLRVLVKPVMEEGTSGPTPPSIDVIRQEIKRSKWLDNSTMNLVFDKYPWLGVRKGELITAMTSLLHPLLAKEHPLVYSKANILDIVTKPRVIHHASKIADLFLERFDPQHPLMDDTVFRQRSQDLLDSIRSDLDDSVTIGLLSKMLDIVSHTLKTNVYMENRYALGLRLDPNIMHDHDDSSTTEKKENPYGILFCHGRRFNGYHVRFRDISRGGLRLITPGNPELLALESARHYDECYGLAYAQQLKNKDIPEGGSKAVCLIDTTHDLRHATKDFVTRKAVKAFTDTILDMVVRTPETTSQMVDYWGKPETLYLGPDEQVIPEDINWIVQQAARRGYATPAAFMSSKPRSGINHKEFGVTSEGVNVYLDVALRRTLGIDPKSTPFTVKLTGGPDGDVGGNEIRILIREYGDNVKIVGIADHSGCAEDPSGLNHVELMRLAEDGLCISYFDPSYLGPDGVLLTVDTEDGIKARNTMHNRVQADAFLPCGGRPNTINKDNYRQFIMANGQPSSPLIVEGANLFVTSEARKALYGEAGIVIVKDSSANKGGVITSSYEICAAMLLSEEEFFNHKDAIVQEVLTKVRSLAKLEAELLFREADLYGGSLPEVSQVISSSINTVTDALSASLDTLSDSELEALLPIFRAHLPETLVNLSFDRVRERVPSQYVKNAIASSLASRLVYKEGTKFIQSQTETKLGTMALKYIQKESEVAKLMESLNGIDISAADKEKILLLLETGGARTALSWP